MLTEICAFAAGAKATAAPKVSMAAASIVLVEKTALSPSICDTPFEVAFPL
jgi:hypothetical protein